MADEHFVGKNRIQLIQRVKSTEPILNGLLSQNVIKQEIYNEIMSIPDSEGRMMALLGGPLKSSGGQKIFCKILKENEPFLMEDLERTEYENVMDKVTAGTRTAEDLLEETLKDLRIKEHVKFKSLVKLKKARHQPTLISRVETLMSVIERLLETLDALSDSEIDEVKNDLLSQIHAPEFDSEFTWRSRDKTDLEDTVFLIVMKYGRQSVKKTNTVLKKMKRTGVIQRMSVRHLMSKGRRIEKNSSIAVQHFRDKQLSALIYKVAEMAAVKDLLLQTLNGLGCKELKKFKWFLQFTHFQKGLPMVPFKKPGKSAIPEAVDSMMETVGQRAVEVTMEVLMDMNRTDLVQMLSESCTELKESSDGILVKDTGEEKDERCSALIQKVETMTSVIWLLLETLADLDATETKRFRRFLLSQIVHHIPHYWSFVDTTDMQVFYIVQTYGQQSVEKTKEILEKMNKSDLIQKLLDYSSGPPNKPTVDKEPSALIHKVATMAAVKQILLETLNVLSNKELRNFKRFLLLTLYQKDVPLHFIQMLTQSTDNADIVDLMVETCGQQSVEVTKMTFMDMNRPDLVENLSTTTGHREKSSVYDQEPALFEKVAATHAVQQILLDTLRSLSHEELTKFRWLLQFMYFQKGHPQILWDQFQFDLTSNLVSVMVQRHGAQAVEVIRELIKDLNRADLIQRLSETSSEPKESSAESFGVEITEEEKDERCSALIQKVEPMTSVIRLLLETLADLDVTETKHFQRLLLSQIVHHIPHYFWSFVDTTDMQDAVFYMVWTFGQQSVQKTREILERMKKTGLMQKLSDNLCPQGKTSVDKQTSALIHKVATMAAVKQTLLETLNVLSYEEIKKFKELLESLVSYKKLLHMQTTFRHLEAKAEIVDLMVETYGQQSVEVTKRIFTDMNRPDLVEMLSEITTGHKEKPSVFDSRPATFDSVSATQALRYILRETLSEEDEFTKFRWLLQFMYFQKGLPQIPWDQFQFADSKHKLVSVMVQRHGAQAVEVTREVFKEMNRTDATQRLSETSSEPKGASRNPESERRGSTMDPSDWTKLEPEVNRAEAENSPTYSLQSEEGQFECSVSGLRWVCKDKVRFKYQFHSWEKHVERMGSMQYMPAGPIIDITVVFGKFHEIYLPHWISIDDSPQALDNFAVLHIDDCGDVVEKASEVTSSHVKLLEPVFSPRAILMKIGIPVRLNCNVLIYKANTAFLTLHVYLIPQDPGLVQEMEKKEISFGYKLIRKPHPDKALKLSNRFILKADLDGAEIDPDDLKLRYESRNPNFFEMYTENPDRNFRLNLLQKDELQPVWSCAIRKDEYQNSGHLQEKESVDEHLPEPAQKAETRGMLLKVLQHLRDEEFKAFKWHLQDSGGLVGVPSCRLEKSDMLDVVDLILQTYNQQSVKVTEGVLKKINRNDLVQMLLDSSSRS